MHTTRAGYAGPMRYKHLQTKNHRRTATLVVSQFSE
jgi:hypothetical protein